VHEVLEHDHRAQAHRVVVAAGALGVRERQPERQQHRGHREVGQQLQRLEQPLRRAHAGDVAPQPRRGREQQRVAQRREQGAPEPRPLTPAPRGDDVEQRRVGRREHRELEDQRRRDLGRAAQGVGRDRQPEVAGVEVAAGHRAHDRLAARAPAQHPDRHVQHAHRDRRQRGDHEPRREHPRDVRPQQRDEQQGRRRDEERGARERLGRRVRQQAHPPDDDPDRDDDADDEEALQHPVHAPITGRA
jgi:hypothetical protein